MKIALTLLILLISMPGCSGKRTVPPEEIVKFESDNVFLEGVLSLPAGSGKHPLAIFIHGSGRVTRQDYEEYVEPMARGGIATFRYDKRGVGASGGTFGWVGTENSEHMFSVLASDAAAAIRHFKNDKRIDSDKIIVIGGSQAGWIIPEVNALTKVWLSVCISGPSVSVGEEIYYSDLAEHGAYKQEQADEMLKDYKGMRGFDPIARIEKMNRPSLWLFGDKDISIPVKRCIVLLDSVKRTKQLPLEMKLYPGADHGLYNAALRRREDHVNFIIDWIGRQR